MFLNTQTTSIKQWYPVHLLRFENMHYCQLEQVCAIAGPALLD